MAAGAAVGVGDTAMLGVLAANFSASSSRGRSATATIFSLLSPAAVVVGVAAIVVVTAVARVVADTSSSGRLLKPL